MEVPVRSGSRPKSIEGCEDRDTRNRDRSSAAGHPVIRKGLVLTVLTLFTDLQVCEMSGVVRLAFPG